MAKRDILAQMRQSNKIVHTIRTRDATPLIASRKVRRVVIQPPPRKGYVAVSITAIGRRVTDGSGQTNPTEESEQT